MKNLYHRLLKTGLVLVFVISSSISYGQINFEEDNLAFLEKIAFTKYENIEKFMNENGYTLKIKNTYTYSYALHFIHSRHQSLLIIYSSSGKLNVTSITVPLLSGLIAEDILKEKNFIETKDETGMQWKNSSYPFHFYIKDTDSLQKIIYILPNIAIRKFS